MFDRSGTAINTLAAELAELLKVDVKTPQHVSAVEWDRACRDELLFGPCCPQHLFGDIQAFWKPAVATALRELKEQQLPLTRHTLMPLIKSSMSVQTTAFCHVHNDFCRVTPCRDSWAGFPCVSWTPQGLKEGDLGNDFVVFCCFAALCLEVEDS